MPDQPYHVYVIPGRGQRDYADCHTALAPVPARMTALSFIGDEDEPIARTRDVDDRHFAALGVERVSLEALALARRQTAHDGSISRTVWRKPFTLIGFAW